MGAGKRGFSARQSSTFLSGSGILWFSGIQYVPALPSGLPFATWYGSADIGSVRRLGERHNSDFWLNNMYRVLPTTDLQNPKAEKYPLK